MIASLITARSLIPAVPVVALIGAAPSYFWLWLSIRIATLPLPKRWYHKLEQCLCWGPYQRLFMFFVEGLSGVEFRVYGDIPEKKDPVNGLVIANHQSTSDTIVIDSFAMRLGNAGYLHFFAKDELKYVPLFGVYWHQHGLIFVKKGQNDIERIRKQLQDKKKNNIPMLMVLFPEGTRFNPENTKAIEKSQAYARSMGYPELTKVLTPRVTGTNLFIEELGDHLEKIFDLTIAYESVDGKMVRPDTIEFLDSVKTVHIQCTQREVTKVGEEKGWLYDSFLDKEKALVEFEKTLQLSEPPPPSHIYSWSAFRETLIPVLYTSLLCSPLVFSSRARKLWLQTFLVVPVLQLLAKPFWK